MIIEKRRASLATLAVTIRALRVDGNSMTASVFRQLPTGREDALSMLWGVVRYEILDEGALWLVFSRDGMLMRRAVDPVCHVVFSTRLSEAERDWNLRKKRCIDKDALWREVEEAREEHRKIKEEEKERARLDAELIRPLPQLFIAV